MSPGVCENSKASQELRTMHSTLTWYYFPSGSFRGDTPLSRFCSLCQRRGPLSLSSLSQCIHTQHPKTSPGTSCARPQARRLPHRKASPKTQLHAAQKMQASHPSSQLGSCSEASASLGTENRKGPWLVRESHTVQQVSWGRDSWTTEQTQQKQETVA